MMKRLMLVCIAAIVMSGCSLISKTLGPDIAKGVNQYCVELNQSERLLIMQSLNAELSPNMIHVHCNGETTEGVRDANPVTGSIESEATELCGVLQENAGSVGTSAKCAESARLGTGEGYSTSQQRKLTAYLAAGKAERDPLTQQRLSYTAF